MFRTDINYRKQCLIKLLHAIEENENEIAKALYKDFKKSEFEAYLTETFIVISELKHIIKNINKWAKPKMVLPSILNFPTLDYVYKEPYGKVLIISPWNYPFQLAVSPAIAAIAAGNSVTIKPSELTPNTSALIAKIFSNLFEKSHVEVIQGGIETSQDLLAKRWDYIFFTGSVSVGKIVAKSAANNLTPVTLELGGKNPCIIDKNCDLDIAAKRLVWGKFVNAGQTCIAPDYLIVEKSIKENLIQKLINEIEISYSINQQQSVDYPRIINKKNWERLVNFTKQQNIVYGGKHDENELFLSPTLIDEPSLESPLMQEEIFGPILPILTYEHKNDIEQIVQKFEKPLALYVFSNDKKFSEELINKFSFGGGCVNDTLIHFANKRLPFGGVGFSGIGAYHGKLSFDIFSHQKAIVKKAIWLDIKLRYAPYKNKIETIKKFVNWL
ncbi:MAG TPA: aldehyde dehydrogenase [Flavobacterium lutivivi]|nr:aldehyde dehydrogenase [Flavobacterium lutivivi]